MTPAPVDVTPHPAEEALRMLAGSRSSGRLDVSTTGARASFLLCRGAAAAASSWSDPAPQVRARARVALDDARA